MRNLLDSWVTILVSQEKVSLGFLNYANQVILIFKKLATSIYAGVNKLIWQKKVFLGIILCLSTFLLFWLSPGSGLFPFRTPCIFIFEFLFKMVKTLSCPSTNCTACIQGNKKALSFSQFHIFSLNIFDS